MRVIWFNSILWCGGSANWARVVVGKPRHDALLVIHVVAGQIENGLLTTVELLLTDMAILVLQSSLAFFSGKEGL